MKYDVFISYSRKDSEVANRVCEAFDRAGINYFIDRQGIGGGLGFPRVLAENIVDSQLFLLLASENAYASKFTTSEIIFAFNKKPKQSILPYIIDSSSLPLELEFTFAGINWRNITDHPIEPTLVGDILRLLGRRLKIAKPIVAEHKKVTMPIITPIEKFYKIGDYYDDGKKQGVVFVVSDGGKHGKIVSLDETYEFWGNIRFLRRKIGVLNTGDGRVNTSVVMNRIGFAKYPAFEWCVKKGEEWYLPARDELMLLSNVYYEINKTLQKLYDKPHMKIGNHGSWYWSSTEYDGSYAWMVDVVGGERIDGYDKKRYCSVRAVATF